MQEVEIHFTYWKRVNIINKFKIITNFYGDWGLGMGDGDWGLGPIPNPQSPFYNQYI